MSGIVQTSQKRLVLIAGRSHPELAQHVAKELGADELINYNEVDFVDEIMKRTDKRGILSDLRDSGEIEQAADVVIFLHRDEVYDPNTPNKGVIEMIVRKNRHGNCGTAYGKASFDVSRIDDMPRGFRPTFSAPAPSSRSRFQGDQGF